MNFQNINLKEYLNLVLSEDIGSGDYTSMACVDANIKQKANLIAKQDGILSGVEIAKELFIIFDPNFNVEIFIKDGLSIKNGDIVLTVFGSAQKILSIERTVLNIIQRMSGIATLSNQYVKAIRHTNCKLLDTRKTTPLFRFFEKQAVLDGGGTNHRFGLYDMMMIKDNHVDYSGGITNAIEKAKNLNSKNNLNLEIELEVRNLIELNEALASTGLKRIMLDNFTPQLLKEAISIIKKSNQNIETEASGGITLNTIASFAETGVDFISVGALTHSAPSLDLSLKASL